MRDGECWRMSRYLSRSETATPATQCLEPRSCSTTWLSHSVEGGCQTKSKVLVMTKSLVCNTVIGTTIAAILLFGYSGLAHAQTPEPLYKTEYRVIDIHCHCGIATEAALLAKFEVMDRVGIDMLVILDGDSPRGSLPA